MRVIQERKRFNVLQCGRRFGKTTLGVRLLSDIGIDGGPAAWFAPTYKYLSDPWGEVNRLLKPLILKSNAQEKRIELLTGGVLDFWSMEDEDAGRGRKYKRVVIDEAGIAKNLQAAWQQSIRPTLTDYRGDAWFLGTPKGRNFFNQLFQKGMANERGWASWRLGTVENPFMPKDEVEGAARDMPRAAYEQEYLGIPADDGANPFGLPAIHACYRPNLVGGAVVAWGVDLAKSSDWTWAIGLDAERRAVRSERWQADWGQTRRRLVDLLGDTPALVDSTGVGDPIVEDLQRVCPGVEGFKFSATSKQQLMEGLASSLQRGELAFADEILKAELESFEFEYTRTGVRYEAPQGLHDDGVCALALANRKHVTANSAMAFSVRSPSVPTERLSVMFDDSAWQ